MDHGRIGALILALRKEKGMTQRQIADVMHISDKTVSKWERGLGCPDVSLLGGLSKVLGVDLENMLEGDLKKKDTDGGNMKAIKFYTCGSCNNVITAMSGSTVSCCGRKLSALAVQPEDSDHKISLADIDDEYYVTVDHPMRKDHYLSFAALVCYDRALLIKLYAEQSAAFRLPKMRRGKLYICCSGHGLFVKEI
ncbi:MAG: transcriptional repressor DicA [Firmicutes bacterium ADurb.Bin193]|nr:MAG: transcriptional repressor DicA [Firmicutes bacterium ADurb.Bin193]